MVISHVHMQTGTQCIEEGNWLPVALAYKYTRQEGQGDHIESRL